MTALGRKKLGQSVWVERAELVRKIRDYAKKRDIDLIVAAELHGLTYNQFNSWDQQLKRMYRGKNDRF